MEFVPSPRRDGGPLPSFHLRPIKHGPLRPQETTGIQELVSSLSLLLELRHGGTGDGAAARAEAHEGGESGVEHILRTTSACNQRCPFCFLPEHGRNMPSADIERELASLARKIGTRDRLTISGGEPLVDARLPGILASARRKGIRRFGLQSNGVGLARPGVLGRLFALGVTVYEIAFHAHKPALYDRMTGSRGQFERSVSGLSRLLASPRCSVTACILINAWNYRELPAMMGYLGRLARRQGRTKKNPLQICLGMLNGRGYEQAPFLAMELRQAAPFLERALARGKREGLLVQRFVGENSLPPCLLRRPEEYAGDVPLAQDRVRYGADFSGEAGSVGRAKLPGCRRCPHDRRCLGVPAPYARMFGLAALRPPRSRRSS
jgi:MoaA/NifB/PqqE/SkfB family radical SAM enzyme